MSAEVWKPVAGYEGQYEVSSQGRVRSIDRTTVRKNGMVAHHKGRLLKMALNDWSDRITAIADENFDPSVDGDK